MKPANEYTSGRVEGKKKNKILLYSCCVFVYRIRDAVCWLAYLNLFSTNSYENYLRFRNYIQNLKKKNLSKSFTFELMISNHLMDIKSKKKKCFLIVF